MTEPHWLVKDFHALYRVAAATLRIETLGDARATRDALRAQIERLKPAFEACEVERRGGNAERLTPAERKALNALHRWLHSLVGDDALTEDAQDFHEHVHAECPSECDRLEEEERLAYGRLVRGELES